jgi:hypothetical protein
VDMAEVFGAPKASPVQVAGATPPAEQQAEVFDFL